MSWTTFVAFVFVLLLRCTLSGPIRFNSNRAENRSFHNNDEITLGVWAWFAAAFSNETTCSNSVNEHDDFNELVLSIFDEDEERVESPITSEYFTSNESQSDSSSSFVDEAMIKDFVDIFTAEKSEDEERVESATTSEHFTPNEYRSGSSSSFVDEAMINDFVDIFTEDKSEPDRQSPPEMLWNEAAPNQVPSSSFNLANEDKKDSYKYPIREDLYPLEKARMMANHMLLERFTECTGESVSQIPWNDVEVHGLPAGIFCRVPKRWSIKQLEAFFESYDKVFFTMKEHARWSRPDPAQLNQKIYAELQETLKELEIIPWYYEKITWKKVEKLAPKLYLTTRDHSRWKESDRNAIRTHILEPYGKKRKRSVNIIQK